MAKSDDVVAFSRGIRSIIGNAPLRDELLLGCCAARTDLPHRDEQAAGLTDCMRGL